MAEMSKVEKVAMAIHAKRRAPDDNKHWFHENHECCELSRQLARAAIEAMRNLSPELKSAGAAAFFSPMPTTHEEENERAASIFRRVIDAALSEEVAG